MQPISFRVKVVKDLDNLPCTVFESHTLPISFIQIMLYSFISGVSPNPFVFHSHPRK